MKPTLLILAAGMGSRYGTLKQMDAFGPNGETIIEYSIYDAIQAGFSKVVFVIRHSFADAFKAKFEPLLKGKIEVEYAYQELTNLPAGFTVPEGREKPWGTGHAIMMAKDVIDTPFAIINADDFYGREAYFQMHDFISKSKDDNEYAMVGYALKNTLSEHGTVSRGVCEVDAQGRLHKVTERTKIGTENGKIYYYEENEKGELTGEEPISMNFWAFKPSFFTHLENIFTEFLKEKGKELKSEFYFNIAVDKLIKAGKASALVVPCDSKWFGVTYPEDKPLVQQKINELIESKKYPNNLWK
jgi:UTP-glucose-1-phosphate uridylyltransferase